MIDKQMEIEMKVIKLNYVEPKKTEKTFYKKFNAVKAWQQIRQTRAYDYALI